MTEQRIAEGAQFMLEHRERLEKAHKETGVAPEYVVAIIGVETFYGRITGKYRVLDALSTLAFDYPQRGEFFRSELAQFIQLSREESVDPLTALGSYAGAMGAPQFMPSSYRRYAVDGSDDQQRNLFADWDDIIASVANYFKDIRLAEGRPGARRRDPAARRAGHGRSRQSRAQRNHRRPQGQGRDFDNRAGRNHAGVAGARRNSRPGRRTAWASRTSKSSRATTAACATPWPCTISRPRSPVASRRQAGTTPDTTQLAAQPAASPTAAR